MTTKARARALRLSLVWLAALVIAPCGNYLTMVLFWPHDTSAVVLAGYAWGVAALIPALWLSVRILDAP